MSVEVGSRAARSGRDYTAGVDLGATKIFSLVLDADGQEGGADTRPTGADGGPEAVIANIVASVEASLAQAGATQERLRGVGMAAPGPIDWQRGVVSEAPNMPGWHEVPLVRRLEEALGVPAWLENDADAAALAEHRFGAGRGVRHMIFITVSSGVGGGLIVDGRLHRGASGAAGEVGHMVLNEKGPLCTCGNNGCLEAYASGLAIAARAGEAIESGRSPTLARLALESPPLSAETVFRAAAAGDEVSQGIIGEAAHYLGLGMVNLVHIFNPELIVIGGGLSREGETFLGPARRVVEQACFEQSRRGLRIVIGALGDRAGALGAIAAMIEGRKRTPVGRV